MCQHCGMYLNQYLGRKYIVLNTHMKKNDKKKLKKNNFCFQVYGKTDV